MIKDDNDRLLAGCLPADPFDDCEEYPPPSRDDDSEQEVTAQIQKPGPKSVRTKPVETRPDVRIHPDVHLTTEAMTKALGADPILYQRAGSLVYLARHVTKPGEQWDADDKKEKIPPGTPAVIDVPLSMLIDRVSKHARCVRVRKNKEGKEDFFHIEPPSKRVQAVLQSKNWPEIRPLIGVIEAPSMRPDGTIIQDPGYDSATGYLFEPNSLYLEVDEKPTKEDAAIAYGRLAHVFCDFPYAGPSHLSATIAAILTLLARPAIRGSVPCWLFDATAARSGKSLQTDVISLVATGRSASRMTFPEQDDELEKVIGGYAIRGSSLINFDNVARKFGGATLDKVITSVDEVDLRVLGASDMRTFAWRAVIFASGNNVSCRGDMLARVLSPRLESVHDNPEARDDFAHADLRAWVSDHRAELVHAALTILRGYVAAGRPEMGCAKWGGFEGWSRLVPHAVVWAGGADPMGARRGLVDDEDPERVYAAAMVSGWDTLTRLSGPMTVKSAVATLYPSDRHEHASGPPDGHDELREAIEALTDTKPGNHPSTRRLGEAIRKLKGRVIGGKRFVSEVSTGKVARWRIV